MQFQSFFHSQKIGWGFTPYPSKIAVVADGYHLFRLGYTSLAFSSFTDWKPHCFETHQTTGYPHHNHAHQRTASVSQSVNGAALITNGSNNRTSVMASPEADEEYDRGHWGSKAEFILSCVGFSVSFACSPYKNV